MAVVALLLVVLTGVITCAAVAIDPALDLTIAAYFQTAEWKAFIVPLFPRLDALRAHNLVLTAAFVLISMGVLAIKLIWPRRPILVPARAALLVGFTFALGPGLLVNAILKPHDPRSRPVAVMEFGEPFVQWWDWGGACHKNCSFVSGEASAAYALLAPAVVVPAPWRYAAIGAAVVYGTGIGVIRMATGDHFLTDIIFSGVFMALIVWLLHGCMYRWKRTRLTEETIAQTIEKYGLAIRAKIAGPFPTGRIGGDFRAKPDISASATHGQGSHGIVAMAPSVIANLGFGQVLFALVALTAIRIVGLHFSVVDLFFDEAQYWAWSRELSFGYFSKPPLLAWAIAATDPICGSGEACVRLASPLFYLGTSLLVYAIAEKLYGQQTAAWSALAFALGTGLTFSARIISTDVPLLFFWAAALLAYLNLLAKPDWRWTIVLGVSFGLGMLAKYAMLYFVLCAALACAVDRDARIVAMRPQTWVAILIGLLLLLPNIYWNAANDFLTLTHTGDNIAGDGFRLRLSGAAGFIGGQFAVAGPMVFAAFLLILVRHLGSSVTPQDRLMLAFAIPPLVLVTALSSVRGANANWAAPAVVSMTVLAVAWWLRHGWKHWLRGTIAVGLVMQAVLLAGDAFADRVTVQALGAKGDLYERTLGWRELGERTADLVRATGAHTVASEGRAETAALIYYLRDIPVRVVSWPGSKIPDHHFDLTRPLGASAAEPIVLVSQCGVASRLRRFYRDVTPLPDISVATGPTTGRHFFAFKVAGRRRAIEPIGSCVEAPE